MSMKPVLYRVETYIVPEANELPVQAAINEMDNIKTINRFKHKSISGKNVQNDDMSPATYNKHMELVKYSAEINELSNRKIMNDVTNKNQTLVIRQEFHNDNECCHKDDLHSSNERLNVQNTKFCASTESQELYPVRQFKRFNSLVSIDEGSEISLETKLSDFCHHGYKNGCTATIPPPEEVSEEIFKENWLQKIEILRQQEAVLREKEMNLQSRERELFRREKELRIAERALRDKIKQVNERELQYQKNKQTAEKRLNKATRILSDELKESNDPAKTERLRNSQPLVSSCEKIDRREESDLRDKKLKHLTRSKSHLSKQPSSSNATSASHTYASIKYKERPKICYEDLNSTLSADPGDSSFVRTSERFNPELYKKPSAFTRSASERWTKQKDKPVPKRSMLDTVEKLEHIEEEKVFKKLSENICASQDKNTKFQNYGLVDCRSNDVQSKVERNLGKEGKFLYLDLEINNKHSQKVTKVFKNRPISWNEEENKWLQKKREAFNLATKKSENKENLKCNTITEKSGKTSKKDVKNKLFTIFR
nr:PREDICTED: trichohyalin-like [Linepithema humile]